MIREIKFRIYSDDLKVMYTPKMNDEEPNLWSLPSALGGNVRAPENSFLMQYTGLKDKNGIEIYEGDIVSFGNRNNVEVVFDNGCFNVFDEPLGWDFDSEDIAVKTDLNFCKVIGNIYQNPELLK